jgi:uncharacterized glyoxalase superfamily protein PhnB
MKPSPKGWPRISTSLHYKDPHKAIDWLCNAFGFEVRLKVEGDAGDIVHSELTFGDGLIMVSTAGGSSAHPNQEWGKSPAEIAGANTQNLFAYVDDIEAHHKRAVAAGAKVWRALETSDYGEDYWTDRSYGCIDPEGHRWYFAQRLKDPK